MKAITYQQYGTPEVLQLREVEKPQPKENEVLVRVVAASINRADWQLLTGTPFPVRLMAGLFRPKNQILGADVAGVVEQVGENVKQFESGDEVFGDLSATGFGAFAAYAVTTEDKLCRKPSNLTFEESAALPMAAVTALQGLRDKGALQAGQKVLINGASGGVGTFALQIAKSFGAEITAVCSTPKVDTAYSLGANHVIDYTKDNFTIGPKRYDLIFDVVSNHSVSAINRVLHRNGRYVTTAFSTGVLFRGPWVARKENKKMINLLASSNQADLQVIKEMVEAGKLTPVIARSFSLSEVPDALCEMGKGRAKGKMIVKI